MATKIIGIIYDDVPNSVLERLRDVTPYADWETIHMLCADAADEIVRLRAEVADWQRTVQAQEVVANVLRAVVNQSAEEIQRLRREVQEARRGRHPHLLAGDNAETPPMFGNHG